MTLDIKTWDNTSLKDFELTDKANIYAPGSVEFYLVQGVISFMQEYRFQVYDTYDTYVSENMLGNYILKILGANKVVIPLDICAKNHLSPKAMWHARVSGVLKPRSLKDRFPLKKEQILFGVYMEAGLTNIAADWDFLEELQYTSPDEARLNHLLSVARLADEKRKEYGIPTITKDYESGNVTVSNLEEYFFQNVKSIPIQTWNRVTTVDVMAKTRGVFHHLGDEMAYIMACLSVGDCCILGQDEVGDLIVLKHLIGHKKMIDKDERYVSQDKNKKLFKKIDTENLTGLVFNHSDFNFIYGVPKSHAMLPAAKNHFFNHLNENKANCALSTVENGTLDNQFWLNKEFLSVAGREIKEYTIKEFVQKFYEVVRKHLKNYSLFETLDNTISTSDFLYKYKQKDTATLSIVEKIDALIEKEFSYFVKTVSPKVNCTVINPQKNTGMGFFSKSGENANLETNTLNLSFLIDKLIILMGGNMGGTKRSENLIKPIYQNFSVDFMEYAIIDFFLHTPANGFWEREERQLYEYWSDLDIKALVVSELVHMDYEYRMFVINGKLVATSACFRNTTPFNAWSEGVLDPRVCQGHNAVDTIMNQDTRNLVAGYAKFARKFIRSVKAANPNILNYVLDVCQSVDVNGVARIIPIEVNSINFSGAYQVDMRRVVAAIGGKPIQKSFINEMFDLEGLMQKHAYTKPTEEKLNLGAA